MSTTNIIPVLSERELANQSKINFKIKLSIKRVYLIQTKNK